MFRNQIAGYSRLILRSGLRHNSSSSAQSAVAKASSAVSSVTNRAAGLVNTTVYWAKVTAELGKHIYLKEGFAPPSIEQFQTVYKTLYKDILAYTVKVSQSPAALRNTVSSINKQQVVTGSAYAIQFFGLFALGEIIGRRNVFGYPHHGSAEH